MQRLDKLSEHELVMLYDFINVFTQLNPTITKTVEETIEDLIANVQSLIVREKNDISFEEYDKKTDYIHRMYNEKTRLRELKDKIKQNEGLYEICEKIMEDLDYRSEAEKVIFGKIY